jgi:hypothetical protein
VRVVRVTCERYHFPLCRREGLQFDAPVLRAAVGGFVPCDGREWSDATCRPLGLFVPTLAGVVAMGLDRLLFAAHEYQVHSIECGLLALLVVEPRVCG